MLLGMRESLVVRSMGGLRSSDGRGAERLAISSFASGGYACGSAAMSASADVLSTRHSSPASGA